MFDRQVVRVKIMRKTAVVAGAGGFVGHHLVSYLKELGYWVRGVDLKSPQYEPTQADEFMILDLRRWDDCVTATHRIGEVYQLAADMGGIGYISSNHSDIARNNVLINAHMIEAAYQNRAERYFFSSSACVYPTYRQREDDAAALKEEHVSPAEPEEGYGWEKLYAEKLCQYYAEERRLETRVARFHNVYGPLGTYDGGREKVPAAICRKTALAADEEEIEVWGDGKQTRSFMYVADCVEGTYRIMQSSYRKPLNLGADHLITIDGLVDLVGQVAGRRLRKRYDPSKPQGVRARNSDNTRLRSVVGWEPHVPLVEGLRSTYQWIEGELRKAGRLPQERAPVTRGIAARSDP